MSEQWDEAEYIKRAIASGFRQEVISGHLISAERISSAIPGAAVFFTLTDLSRQTDVPLARLFDYVNRKGDPYRRFEIRSRGNAGHAHEKTRVISVPEPFLKKTQRWLATNVLNHAKVSSASTAFAPRSSIVNAASHHCDARWLIKMDLQSFFDHVNEFTVFRVFKELGFPELLSFQLARICTFPLTHAVRTSETADASSAASSPHRSDQDESFASSESKIPWEPGASHEVFHTLNATDLLQEGSWESTEPDPAKYGALPQGAPTSPMLANLAARSLDAKLGAISRANSLRYSRYADDLAFSTTNPRGLTRSGAVQFLKQISHAAAHEGFRINRKKTRICGPGSRKELLGLNVDRNQPRLSKRFRSMIDTHVMCLTHPEVGLARHADKRGFRSKEGLMRHVFGLLAFARSVDPHYVEAKHSALRSGFQP